MTKRDDRPSDSAVAEFPFRRLTHDILVNVIANLIAAAIIYLFGAVVGLLPSEPRAILVAAGFLTMALGMLTLAIGKNYNLSKKQQKRDASLAFFTVGFFLLGLSIILAALFPVVFPWWKRIGYIIMGLACLLLSYLGFWGVRKTRQIRQRRFQ